MARCSNGLGYAVNAIITFLCFHAWLGTGRGGGYDERAHSVSRCGDRRSFDGIAFSTLTRFLARIRASRL